MSTQSQSDSERAVLEKMLNWDDAGSRITAIGFVANTLLTLSKGVAGWQLNSASLLAEATHGTSDMLADLVILGTWTVTRQQRSLRWPTACGKVETLVSAMVALSMLAAAVGVGMHSGGVLMNVMGDNTAPPLNAHAAWFAAIGAFTKEWLYRRTTRVANEQSSSILNAYAQHHRADAVTSLVALASIALTGAGFTALDSLGGILASVAIIAASVTVLRDALYELLDVGVDEATIAELRGCLSDDEKHVRSISATRSGGQLLVYVDIKTDASEKTEEKGSEDVMKVTQSVKTRIQAHRGDVRGVFVSL